MASVTYKVRSNSSLYFRIRNGRDLDVTLKLPFVINNNNWSCAKQKLSGDLLVNSQLINFKAHLLNELNIGNSNQEKIDLAWVKSRYNKFFYPNDNNTEPVIDIIKYIEYYVKQVKPKTHKFSILMGMLENVIIGDIDLEYLENFRIQKLSEGYSENYIAKLIQLLKRVLKYANKNGQIVKNEVFEFSAPTRETISTYLNEIELEQIFKYIFNNDRLNNVKKLFLVGCTTGLRVSDLMQIKSDNISNEFIEVEAIKTKQLLLIPIDPRVKEFISELKAISDQKFNVYIKELCQTVGINEPTRGYIRDKQNKRVLGIYPKYSLITSHTMRRSFASNLYGKVPTVVIIMAITGHTTEKSFLTYIKKPQRDFAEQLKKYYLERCK